MRLPWGAHFFFAPLAGLVTVWILHVLKRATRQDGCDDESRWGVINNALLISDTAFTNAAIEFHDSTVAMANRDGATVTIVLSPAYVHRSPGTPGIDRGTGWSQDVLLVLYDCLTAPEFPELPLVLYDGLITIGDQTYDGAVPLPLSNLGPVHVDLSFENSAHLRLSAAKIRVDAIGGATYLDEFPGVDA